MAEYTATQLQTVALNQAAIFNAATPCFLGGTEFFENGTGTFLLRGVVQNPFIRFAVYRVTFRGNIAIPEGGTAGPIAVALTVNGEVRGDSLAITTPAAVEEFDNVTSSARIVVPRGSSLTVSLRHVAASSDASVTPAPAIEIQNGNIIITREF